MGKLKLLFRCVNYYGLKSGVSLFLRIETDRLSKIRLKGLRHPFTLRSKTTDLSIFYQVFFNQSYSLKLSYEPKVIIDAGANIGLASIFFANRYPDATIYALEVEERNFSLLEKNCQPYSNIIPIKKALWNKNTKLKLVNAGYGESGFMVKEVDAEEGDYVEAISINSLIEMYEIKYLDLLKIDIEGSELEVFAKDYSWLTKTRALIIETHDSMRPGSSKSVLISLSKYDFNLSLAGENLVFINETF